MKVLYLFMITYFLANTAWSQNLYVPTNAEITITNGTVVTTGGELENEGRFRIVEGSELVALGNINNLGFFINDGKMLLFRDWNNTGTYNGSLGEMVFLGGEDQRIINSYLNIKNLTVNKTGTVTLEGDSILITNTLNFESGILTKSANAKVIVASSARVDYTIGSMSYFEGEIIARGTRDRRFPVGNNGFFGTIGLINLRGTAATEFGLSMIHQNSEAPVPGLDLIGVSDENVWKVDFIEGFVDSLQVEINFISEDLENFTNKNITRRRFDSPVIAVADSTPIGPYRSIGIAELIDTDSITFGRALSLPFDQFNDYGAKYFAVGLAPRIDPDGQIYFPNVFAPAASDARNKNYRIFGELIANEPFKLEIYNKFSQLVYEAKTFEEASTMGWDGSNKHGNKEYTGVFYVNARYAFKNSPDKVKKYSGSIFLKR